MNLKIAGRSFTFFNNFSVTLAYDAIASAFTFRAYFNPDNPDHKTMMRPGSFHLAEVSHNDELLIRGPVLSHGFAHGTEKELASLSGYTIPGVLEDCPIPPSIYPLQFDGLSMKEIAQKIIEPFGLTMVIDGTVRAAMDDVYDVTNIKETQSAKGYLTELATQKNIILSHTAAGSLFFTKAKTKQKPILDFDGGAIPGTTMALSFNAQPMHSHITVMKDVDMDGGNAGEETVRNPFVRSREEDTQRLVGSYWLGGLRVVKSGTKIYNYRPAVIRQTSGTDTDTGQSAATALAAEMKNITLTITTDRWEVDGKIIRPNNIISVRDPELFLYRKTNWFIERVELNGDNKATTATLTCVLPSVYDGSEQSNIFA